MNASVWARTRALSLSVVVGLALAACGTSQASRPAAPASTTRPVAQSPSPSRPPSRSRPPSPSRSPSPRVGAAPACGFAQLRVKPLNAGEAGGSAGQAIGFTNVSLAVCSLHGYPAVAALNASGQPVVRAERELSGMLGGERSGHPQTVNLAPGQTASSEIEGTDHPMGNQTTCPYYPRLAVTPPDTTQSVEVGIQFPGTSLSGFPGCTPIRVDPIVPGSLGRD